MIDSANHAASDTTSFDARLRGVVSRVVTDCENEGSTDVIARVNAAVKAEYDALEDAGKYHMAFLGCRIVGGVALMPPGLKQLHLIPATAFHPQARHLHDDRDALALGFSGEYDLYLQSQVGLPPTLLARYGDQPSEYSSFNPSFMKVSDLHAESRPAFSEALARARALALMR